MTAPTTRTNMRIKHHAVLTVITALLLWAVYTIVPGDDKKYVWSMATAYTSIILLGVTLILGPLNVLKKKNNPVSSDLRRDIGIWCGLTGIAHIIIGIQVHMGNIWLYFFNAVEGAESFKFRSDLFGTANYIGLFAGVILFMLVLLSNDLSMKVLRPGGWKRLQQCSYLCFILTMAHGIMYIVIEKRTLALIILFSFLMLIPLVIQVKGFLFISRK